ncbi:MarR family winged helix-turn-helix transcriptional regulator [Micromonospora sp. SL4-19]|uniref:MarR family winged helix-turn-helix transcriptional regulator n=1 Tax=Micromonospora sp. SL4-19 TaxID=3399129 RepID=UPI003A4DAE53
MPATHDGESARASRRRGGAAFLLAQVGAHASSRFAERIADLGLTPPQAGLLRAIAAAPASSQQQLATQLGLLPSRVVAFVDDLESRGLLRRERSRADRRQYALHLTQDGEALMRRLQDVARAHERDLCQALDQAEHAQLVALLGRIADQQGLTAGVHPGYTRLTDSTKPAVRDGK